MPTSTKKSRARFACLALVALTVGAFFISTPTASAQFRRGGFGGGRGYGYGNGFGNRAYGYTSYGPGVYNRGYGGFGGYSNGFYNRGYGGLGYGNGLYNGGYGNGIYNNGGYGNGIYGGGLNIGIGVPNYGSTYYGGFGGFN